MMIKKSIAMVIAIAIMVAAVALVFANSGNIGHINSTNSNLTNQQNVSTNSTSVNGNNSNNASNLNPKSTSSKSKIHFKITPAQAKKIAQECNEMPGEIAGTPILDKEYGEYMYIVPYYKNGKIVGYIGIDPQTGDTSEI